MLELRSSSAYKESTPMIIRFRAAFVTGLRDAVRLRLALPLYLAGLLIALVQSWPVLVSAGNGQLRQINIERLLTSGDALLELFTKQETAAVAGTWLLLAPLLSMLYGACYNLFSGGILSVWAGTRRFWPGSVHFFWSFTGLGLVLVILALVVTGLGSALVVALGTTAGAVTTFAVLQLLNLVGEYARALGVTRERRNPFALFGGAVTFIVRHPVALLLGLLGLALHVALVAMYLGLAPQFGASPLAIILNQVLVFVWLWVKLLRLAWARGLVASDTATQPQFVTEPGATSAPVGF